MGSVGKPSKSDLLTRLELDGGRGRSFLLFRTRSWSRRRPSFQLRHALDAAQRWRPTPRGSSTRNRSCSVAFNGSFLNLAESSAQNGPRQPFTHRVEAC